MENERRETHNVNQRRKWGEGRRETYYESRVGGRDARKNGADGRAVSRYLSALD